MTLEHSREELRTAKVECSAAQSRAKQLSMQADIQQQREATRRAEERLRGLDSSPVSHPAQQRPHYQQDIQSRQQRQQQYPSKHPPVTSASSAHRSTSSHLPGLEEAQLSALQQSGYLQHLMEVDLATHSAAASNHRNEWQSHPPPPPAVSSQHHPHLHRPPIPPRNQPSGHPQHSQISSAQLRASLERSEGNLDRDVVLESMMAQHYPPSSSAAPAQPPRLPPRARTNSGSSSLYSNSTNTATGGTERSLLSIRAQQRSLGQYQQQDENEEQEREGGSSRGRYVSMSDSEVEPRDRYRDRESAALLRSSADMDRHRDRDQATFHHPARHEERSALSFIRQRAISSSSIGSDSHTRASYNLTGTNTSAGSTSPQRSERASMATPSSRAAEQVRTSRDSTPSVSSSTAPFSRLQALYEKVANKTI